MAITFAGLTWQWWITVPLLMVLVAALGGAARALWHQHWERIELEQEGTSDESSPAQEDGPVLTDDHYPAAPALPAAGPSADPGGGQDGAGGGGMEQDVSEQPPDRSTSRPHYLAAVTQGETLQEEIDRMEARLVLLYEQQRQEAAEAGKALAAQVAASVAEVDRILASGQYACAWWLDVGVAA